MVLIRIGNCLSLSGYDRFSSSSYGVACEMAVTAFLCRIEPDPPDSDPNQCERQREKGDAAAAQWRLKKKADVRCSAVLLNKKAAARCVSSFLPPADAAAVLLLVFFFRLGG